MICAYLVFQIYDCQIQRSATEIKNKHCGIMSQV